MTDLMADLGIAGIKSCANGINDSGQIVGWSNYSGQYQAFLYSDGVFTDLGTLGRTPSGAEGINNSGQIVGYTYATGYPGECAFLYSGGVIRIWAHYRGTHIVTPMASMMTVKLLDIQKNTLQ